MATIQDIARLEQRLARLIRRWERFVGNDPEVRVPPELERVALEQALREASREESRGASEQFRLEQLLHRFSTYNGLWQRQLREREEARASRGISGRMATGDNSVPPASVSAGEAALQSLHREYLAALEAAGSRAAIGLDRFREALDAQRAALESRGAVVEGFEVTQDEGKVKVRARVRRGRSV